MYEFGFLVCLVGDVLLSSGCEGTYYRAFVYKRVVRFKVQILISECG